MVNLTAYSQETQKVLTEPFTWCFIKAGKITLEDASDGGGTQGGVYTIGDFAIGKYLITNLQYKCFVEHENGYCNPEWWGFSPEAIQWRKVRSQSCATAFAGDELPRTRVSWFESMAFCAWLSQRLNAQSSFDVKEIATWTIRLPTEQEWQRAALGDTKGPNLWGDLPLDETRANYENHIGRPTSVGSYPAGASPYGVLDMIGNLSEWCITKWGTDGDDVTGYGHRYIRGAAWNVINKDFIQANDRVSYDYHVVG